MRLARVRGRPQGGRLRCLPSPATAPAQINGGSVSCLPPKDVTRKDPSTVALTRTQKVHFLARLKLIQNEYAVVPKISAQNMNDQ
jgi:hypothetical protein